MIKTEIIGHVGGAPKFIKKGDSRPCLSFNVASNSVRNGKKYTDWINVTLWGPLAEKMQPYVLKGRLIRAQGRPQAQAYLKKNKNEPAATLVLHTDEFQLLDAKPEELSATSDNASAE